jgi:type IV secretory pathway VirB2 component (pilin)/type IV secretory pathway TrbD component
MIHAIRHGARRAMLAATAGVVALTFAVPAHAGGSSMPWEAPLQSILESIEGPVAKIIAVIIIIVTGLTLAFGDTRRLPPADPDRVRPVDRVRRQLLLPELLQLRRRGAGLMLDVAEPIAGFHAPVHRALTEPILLGGARARSPSSTARWRARSASACASGSRPRIWAIGHALSVWAARRDPQFVDVARRHLRYPFGCSHDELARISAKPRASPTSCPGPRWSAKGRSQQGRLVPAHRAFRGPDLDSATPAELVATTARLNNALRRLGSGWAIFVEAQRTPALDYPEGHFPDPVSSLVDSSAANSSARKARISRAAIS